MDNNNLTTILTTISRFTTISYKTKLLLTTISKPLTTITKNITNNTNSSNDYETQTKSLIIIVSIITTFISVYLILIIINICKNTSRNRIAHNETNRETNIDIDTESNQNNIDDPYDFEAIQNRNLQYIRNSIVNSRNHQFIFNINTTTTISTTAGFLNGDDHNEIPPDYNYDKPPDYTELNIETNYQINNIIESRI